MTAGISIVVPVKGLRAGKSRLAQTMTDDARWELNRHLTERTLGIATAFADTADVYAVSPDPDVEEIAASFSVRFLHQSGDGLNPGLEEAACQLPGAEQSISRSTFPISQPTISAHWPKQPGSELPRICAASAPMH